MEEVERIKEKSIMSIVGVRENSWRSLLCGVEDQSEKTST